MVADLISVWVNVLVNLGMFAVDRAAAVLVADVVARGPVVETDVQVDIAMVGTTLLNTVRVVGADVWTLAVVVEGNLGKIDTVVSVVIE